MACAPLCQSARGATDTLVLYWRIPNEWNIRAAHIKKAAGNTIRDFVTTNLHVPGHSVPVAKIDLPLAAL